MPTSMASPAHRWIAGHRTRGRRRRSLRRLAEGRASVPHLVDEETLRWLGSQQQALRRHRDATPGRSRPATARPGVVAPSFEILGDIHSSTGCRRSSSAGPNRFQQEPRSRAASRSMPVSKCRRLHAENAIGIPELHMAERPFQIGIQPRFHAAEPRRRWRRRCHCCR